MQRLVSSPTSTKEAAGKKRTGSKADSPVNKRKRKVGRNAKNNAFDQEDDTDDVEEIVIADNDGKNGKLEGDHDAIGEDDEQEGTSEEEEEDDDDDDPYLYYSDLQASIQSYTRKENVCSECEYASNDLIECKGSCQQLFHLDCLGFLRCIFFAFFCFVYQCYLKIR